MARVKNRKQDVIVVGTGPAGATAALEMVRKGRKVLMIETGRDDPVGRGLFHTFHNLYDKHLIFSRSKEGILIDRALTLGGSSAVFSGNAFRPTASFQSDIGMDLEDMVEETIEELNLAPFPDTFMEGWNGTRQIVEAASALNIDLKPQLKFIDPTRCNPKCDSCMSGCAINARWTARDYVRKAMAWPGGADLVMETTVEQVFSDDSGKAVGVIVKGKGTPDKLFADTVILAAGGMSTPVILQKSGVDAAGKAFFMDPMDVAVGFTQEPGPWRAMTFTHACEDFVESDKFLIGNVKGSGAWLSQLLRGKTFFNNVLRFKSKGLYALGMFTKVADETQGRIYANGKISKSMTAEDEKHMARGDELCREILLKAGCIPHTISVSRLIGGHPGGTAAMGGVVDDNLEVKGLPHCYVCDTSVFPRSPGVPPVLTLIAMVKKWARTLYEYP